MTGPAGTGLARVARGGVLNLAGAAVAAAASVGLTVVVTRAFNQAAAGAFFVATSLFLIAETVTGLGACDGTIYFIARLRALGAERRIPAIVRAAVVPVALAAATGAVALIAFAHPLARALLGGAAAQRQDGVAEAIRVLALALPFAALADTMLGTARGYQEMRPTVAVDRVGRSGLQLLGAAVAAALAGGLLSGALRSGVLRSGVLRSGALWPGLASSGPVPLAVAWALPYVPAAICSALWLRRVMRRHRVPSAVAPPMPPVLTAADLAMLGRRHGKPSARGFWRFTAPRSAAALAQIVVQRLDIVLVGIMRGPAAAAVYTAATRFLVAGQLGNAAIAMAAQPQLARLFAIGDRPGARAVYQATTAWLVLLSWPLYLLAAVFGPSVLAVFGRSYQAGGSVMVILAMAMLVASACGQVDVVLITAGRSGASLANGLLAMSVNVGLDVVLIPAFGIAGAAVGWAAAIVITNLLPLVQVALAVGVHPFGRRTIAACGLAGLSFGAIPLALRAIAGTGPAVLGAATVLGGLTLVAGLWLLRGPTSRYHEKAPDHGVGSGTVRSGRRSMA